MNEPRGWTHLYLIPARRGYRLFSPALEDALTRELREGDTRDPAVGRWRRTARAARRGYRRATRSRTGRERLLTNLGDPTGLEVSYPARLSEGEARRIFRELLEGYVRKHRRWLLANGALMPLGVLLTLVPGPNVVLAYLGWRTLSHFKSHRGGQTALGRPDIRFRPEPGLDALLDLAAKAFVLRRRERMRRVGERMGIEGLERLA